MIIPEIAAGAAAELDELRAACDVVVGQLLAARPSAVWIIGGAATTGEYAYPFRASFAPWGLPLDVRLGPAPDTAPALPLSLAVGVWLVRRVLDADGGGPPVSWFASSVAVDADPQECARLGRRLAATAARSAMLVMGDGSACRGQQAPGYLDPRADQFDAAAVRALAAADPDGLLALDPVLGAELMVAGRAPWQVLAGAAAGTTWRGEVLYGAAPYGVTYTVASWQPRTPTEPDR